MAKATGRVPDGWRRQGLQVPTRVATKFQAQSSKAGVGGIKVLGTAALAIITEMPDDMRFALMRRVAQQTWPDADEFVPKDIWRLLIALVVAESGIVDNKAPDAEERIRWYVDRILDPELTPPPGEKASDRRKGKREERA